MKRKKFDCEALTSDDIKSNHRSSDLAKEPVSQYPTISGIPGRKFPFRATNEEEQAFINKQANAVLLGIECMVFKLVRQRNSGGWDDDVVHELAQKCMIWLWQKSLPKYDATRGVKVSTFLYRCINNFLNQETRSMARKGKHAMFMINMDHMELANMVKSHGDHSDQVMESAAEAIMKHPEKYLTASQTRVFEVVVHNPHIQMKDLAKRLGYRRPSSLSMMMRRIRERINQVSLDADRDF